MTRLQIGCVAETEPGENRVALTPDAVGRLQAAGLDVLVETGAGRPAWYADAAYTAAGARVLGKEDLYQHADVVVAVHPPASADRALLRPGQILLALLQPLAEPALAAELAEAKVTAVSLDGLPRTLSRAQAMDALTSQANVAGYKAALVAADTYGGYFPMLMTAAGTIRPAAVLVLGAGVAGLQAIATTRRLGAVVTGYDVREAARADIASAGAAVLDLDGPSATGAGGYARELSADEESRQQQAMAEAIARFDMVITTAQVPGRRPPLLVSAAALAGMRPGSVVVDLAAGPAGGNVVGSEPDSTIVTAAVSRSSVPPTCPPRFRGRPPRPMPATSRRCSAHLVQDGDLVLDAADEITAGVLVVPGRPGRASRRRCRAERARRHRERDGSKAMTPTLFADITIFVLSLLVGFEVITKVPATLHTPLMSGSNAIHGVVVVGVMMLAATVDSPAGYVAAVRRRRRSPR